MFTPAGSPLTRTCVCQARAEADVCAPTLHLTLSTLPTVDDHPAGQTPATAESRSGDTGPRASGTRVSVSRGARRRDSARAHTSTRSAAAAAASCSSLNKRICATHFSFTVSSLKMCTVSVLLEAERNMPSMLKAREQMLTHLGDKGKGPGLRRRPETPRATGNLPEGLLPKATEKKSSHNGHTFLLAFFLFLSSHCLKNVSERKMFER